MSSLDFRMIDVTFPIGKLGKYTKYILSFMHMIFWYQIRRMYLVEFLKHLALPAFPLSH